MTIEQHKQLEPENLNRQPLSGLQDFISTGNIARTEKTLNVKNFYIFNDVEAYLGKGQRFSRTAFSGSNYTAAVTDYLVGITSLAIAPTIGLPLPSIVGVGKTFRIKDEIGGAATTTITIQVDGEKTIDGASSATITANYGSKLVYTDGANYFTL